MVDRSITYLRIVVCVLAVVVPVCTGTARSAHAATNGGDVVVKQESVTQNFPEQEVQRTALGAGNGKRETVDVPVISWRDIPFQTVKRQALDYSCGSAALSTLLSYVYDNKTSEGEVFKAMFDAGDQDKIKREGFSLLDMSNYLNTKGYKAVGYKAGLDSIEKKKVPFIALINDNGYNHFVVVKSIRGPFMLIGDPNKGNVIHHRDAFEKAWNGIALVITNHAKAAQAHFDDEKEWTYARRLADPAKSEYAGMDSVVLPSIQWQVAPTMTNLLGSVPSTTEIVQQLSSNVLSTGGVQ